jgi:hypothetical protein
VRFSGEVSDEGTLSGEFPAAGITGRAWVRVDGAPLARPFWLRLGVADDGRPICTGLVIDSDPERELTARDLRRIPISDVLTRFARSRMSPNLQAALEQQPARRPRPGSGGHSNDHYGQVARAYKRAKRKYPRAPIRALMVELHASEPTVHRWLREATKRGFLQPRARGRVPEEKP